MTPPPPVLTLVLEASTYAGSVALLRDHEVLAERVLADSAGPMRGSRAEGMMPAIADCVRAAGVSAADVSRIICGEGPGSFTSLRIAASLAKGMAHSLDIPLYAVSSLLLLAAGESGGAKRQVAAINAMRGEVFVAEFHAEGDGLTQHGIPEIIAESALAQFAAHRHATLIRAGFDGINPVASSVLRVLAGVIERGPVDLASWEPTYGRLAEAQLRWEKAAGKPLGA